MSGLEMVRSRLLVQANTALDDLMAPLLLDRMLSSAINPEGGAYLSGLKDLNTLKAFLTGPSIFALFDAPWFPIYLLILYLMSPLLLGVALAGAVLMLVLTALTDILTRSSLQESGNLSRVAAAYVAGALRNSEVVNAMGMVPGVTNRWAALNSKTIELQTKASVRAGAVSGMTKFVRQFLQSIMLGVGAYLVITGDGFTAGMMIAGTIVFGRAMSPIENVIASWKSFAEARAAYGRLSQFFRGQEGTDPHLPLPPPSGHVQLERVTFGIRSTGKVILKDLSFSLAAGESLGIIGPSASGKSSVARMLTGVWRPVTGTVRIDGSDLISWPREELGPHIGYLPQDVELFEGTIADNIARLGEPATGPVIEAAKLAGVHDIILRMPMGYDTQIGEGGAVLSGGQRQRIGLARALFGSPRLVVLDEPNASLDTDGERALLDALRQLKRANVTTVLITHKLSLLSLVDKLLVMQDGAMAVFGPRQGVLEHLEKSRQAGGAKGVLPGQAVNRPVMGGEHV
jgi:PrtD family type I secretion system ABC transporter